MYILFIFFDCAGSRLLLRAFLSCSEWGYLQLWSGGFYCSGFLLQSALRG